MTKSYSESMNSADFLDLSVSSNEPTRTVQTKKFILTSFCLITTIFFIPLSPSLKSIFSIASLLVILSTPQYYPYLKVAYNSLWGRAALLFFTYIVIACLWSPAPFSMQLSLLDKYAKLMYLPILAVAFINPKLRAWCLHSYLAAMLLTCIISVLKSMYLLPNLVLASDPGAVFHNHIVTGFMIAFAFYIASILATKSHGWLRAVYVSLALLSSYQILFINTGRAAYIVYGILWVLILVQVYPWKKAIFSMLFLASLAPVVYMISPIMQERVQQFVTDVHFLKQSNKNTSLGYRMQFHQYAQSLLSQSPVIGIGTGGFKHSYTRDQPVPAWGPELSEPHSQYWMTLAEQGIIGMLLLVFFLASLFKTVLSLKQTRPILLGMLTIFSISALSDTILCYSALGYLLIMISALCLGELLEKSES